MLDNGRLNLEEMDEFKIRGVFLVLCLDCKTVGGRVLDFKSRELLRLSYLKTRAGPWIILTFLWVLKPRNLWGFLFGLCTHIIASFDDGGSWIGKILIGNILFCSSIFCLYVTIFKSKRENHFIITLWFAADFFLKPSPHKCGPPCDYTGTFSAVFLVWGRPCSRT